MQYHRGRLIDHVHLRVSDVEASKRFYRAVFASLGLEALGLGPFESNTMGMTIYWNIWYGSLLNGWWWWWSPPIIMIVLLFVGLFLISRGLDEWANPRLRRGV